MNNFLISCYGRSGSKFLSSLMNRSDKWTVLHEPRCSFDEFSYKNGDKLPERIINDFNKNYYGEVNSYMRFYFNDLNVEKKGIILRNPKDIIKSVANRKPINMMSHYIQEINQCWILFNKWVNLDNIYKIDFEQLTSDKDYLNDILKYFGINDIDLNSINLTKSNTNSNEQYRTFNDLPKNLINLYNIKKW